MTTTIFENFSNTGANKNRSVTMAAAAGALTGLCGAVLDERSTAKTIGATALYGAATVALIDATVPISNPSTMDCYITYGVVATATSLVGHYVNNQFGDDPSTEE